MKKNEIIYLPACKIKQIILYLCHSGYARSYSLDLVDQYEGLQKTSQFRFTPPTHAMLAFEQALLELKNEGGIEGRSRRYVHQRQVLIYCILQYCTL